MPRTARPAPMLGRHIRLLGRTRPARAARTAPQAERPQLQTLSDAYQTGHAHGLADGRTIAQPGATLEQRELVAGTYVRALGPFADDYLIGYADGVDAAATETGYTAPSDEEISEFYVNL